jgi:putative transposase
MLVVDTGEDVIPQSLQLIAGRTAQEYNIRKKRKGAFWEDRYHATAVQTDEHLAKCLVYIDLNMVRAGVVQHPSAYGISGYNEIQTPPKRYSIVLLTGKPLIIFLAYGMRIISDKCIESGWILS